MIGLLPTRTRLPLFLLPRHFHVSAPVAKLKRSRLILSESEEKIVTSHQHLPYAQLFDTIRKQIPRLNNKQIESRLNEMRNQSMYKTWTEHNSWSDAEISYIRRFAESDRDLKEYNVEEHTKFRIIGPRRTRRSVTRKIAKIRLEIEDEKKAVEAVPIDDTLSLAQAAIQPWTEKDLEKLHAIHNAPIRQLVQAFPGRTVSALKAARRRMRQQIKERHQGLVLSTKQSDFGGFWQKRLENLQATPLEKAAKRIGRKKWRKGVQQRERLMAEPETIADGKQREGSRVTNPGNNPVQKNR